MLEYDRIDISAGIDVNKSNDKSKNVIFAIIGIFYIRTLLMRNISVMVVMI